MIWNSRKGEFFLKKSFDSVIWCGLSSVFFSTKNTAAEDAAIIMTVGKELLLSSVITVVGMKTVVEDPGLNELVF